MSPLEMFLTLVIVGLSICDAAISFARGKIGGSRAVITVGCVIVLCIVAAAVF